MPCSIFSLWFLLIPGSLLKSSKSQTVVLFLWTSSQVRLGYIKGRVSDVGKCHISFCLCYLTYTLTMKHTMNPMKVPRVIGYLPPAIANQENMYEDLF